MASSMTPAQAAQAAAQANAYARQAVLTQSVPALQQIYSQTGLNPATQNVVNISPRNVGIIKGFWVHLGVNGISPSGPTITKTVMGAGNLIQLLTFNDLSNQQRINVAGWCLPYLDTARRRHTSNASYLATGTPASQASGQDTPLNLQANYTSDFALSGTNTPLMSCPLTVATATAFQVDYWTYVPISYTDRDLRGAIYAGVVNSVMNLQITFNYSNFVASSTADPSLAVFQSSSAVTALGATTWSVEVYQDFLDQIPFSNQGPVLPFQDMSWSYLLNTTFFTGMSAGQDFPIPLPNFRNIQSMLVAYDNNGLFNSGNDINYLALQSANYTNIFKVSPALQAIITRNLIGTDMPKGVSYFDFRAKPLSTVQYGNLNLVVNPKTVTNTIQSQFLVCFEQLAMQNQVVGAGSIPGG